MLFESILPILFPNTVKSEFACSPIIRGAMPGEIDQYGFERLQLPHLADLDRLVAERFELPLRPYSTDVRAAFELVIWVLDHDEYPYFCIFRSEEAAFPDQPLGVGFALKMWRYGETAAFVKRRLWRIGICLAALYQLRQVEVSPTVDER